MNTAPSASIASIRISFGLIFLFGLGYRINAATHHVTSPSEVESLIEEKSLLPGDTIVLADGVYQDMELNIEGIDGTATQAITLRAATPGEVVLRGESEVRIGAEWWVIEGLTFDGGSEGINSYNPIQLRSQSGKSAQHVRVTNCAMTNLTTDQSTSKWVLIYGRYNTIDHCHFSGKNSKGALITIELGDLGANDAAGHRIEWNYFGDVAPHEGSDNETIRIGYSGDQAKRAECVVKNNYFVRCNGENEIVSNKSSFNSYIANTFRQCDGALVLRHGSHATVEGNYFFGDGAADSGGIRVVDSHHVISNNYLQDLTGLSWNAALSILGGDQSTGGTSDGYQAVDGVAVVHNTIVNCRRSVLLSKVKGRRAPTGLVANNLIASPEGPLLVAEISAEKLAWEGNLLHGPQVGTIMAASTDDPLMQESNRLLRPSASGPAANRAVEIPMNVQQDIDGQSRPNSGRDIGADEVDGAVGKVRSPPLEPADVGVTFLKGSGPRLSAASTASPSSVVRHI